MAGTSLSKKGYFKPGNIDKLIVASDQLKPDVTKIKRIYVNDLTLFEEALTKLPDFQGKTVRECFGKNVFAKKGVKEGVVQIVYEDDSWDEIIINV